MNVWKYKKHSSFIHKLILIGLGSCVQQYAVADQGHFLALHDTELNAISLSSKPDQLNLVLQADPQADIPPQDVAQYRLDQFHIQQIEQTVFDQHQQQKTLRLPSTVVDDNLPKKFKIFELGVGVSNQANTVQIITEDKIKIWMNPSSTNASPKH